jgi:hypothetical protein
VSIDNFRIFEVGAQNVGEIGAERKQGREIRSKGPFETGQEGKRRFE